jgi:hypothetical protein
MGWTRRVPDWLAGMRRFKSDGQRLSEPSRSRFDRRDATPPWGLTRAEVADPWEIATAAA